MNVPLLEAWVTNPAITNVCPTRLFAFTPIVPVYTAVPTSEVAVEDAVSAVAPALARVRASVVEATQMNEPWLFAPVNPATVNSWSH